MNFIKERVDIKREKVLNQICNMIKLFLNKGQSKNEEEYLNDIVESIPDYENFKALCPHCNYLNIFNRVSDLKTTEPIWGKNVNCQRCKNEFRIGFDEVGTNYHKLILQCPKLIKQKEYMTTVITLCIAYEMFFQAVIYHYLVDSFSLQDKEILTELLDNVIAKYTFNKLYNEFIKIIIFVNDKNNISVDCAKDYIKNIDGTSVKDLNSKLTLIKNEQVKKSLLELFDLNNKQKLINHIRNKVVHKNGYRPTKEEAIEEYEYGRKLILKLEAQLILDKNIK